MATILNDTFAGPVGQALATHDANWIVHPGMPSSNIVIDASGTGIRGNQAGENIYSYNVVLGSADYTVLAHYWYIANASKVFVGGILGRLDPTALTCYYLSIRNTGLNLHKYVAGGLTQIGVYNTTITGGVTYTIALIMTGSTIEATLNGVTRISVTDTAVTAAGRPGVYLRSNAVGEPTSSYGARFQDISATTQTVDVTLDVSGGIVYGGTGSIDTNKNPDHTIPVSGGVVFGGEGSYLTYSVPPFIIEPSGGITFGGTGSILNEKSPPHIIEVEGGIVFNGSNAMLFNYVVPTGGPRMPLLGVGI